MELENRRYWQFAAGDKNRNFVDVCLDWDVMLIGPGYLGLYPEKEPEMKKAGFTPNRISMLRLFCVEVNDGDIIVLRLGTSEVHGVGVVKGEVEWHDDFGDIDGWDLQIVRRVKWFWKRKGNSDHPELKTYSLKFGDTIQSLNDGEVKDWVLALDKSDADKPLSYLHQSNSKLGDSEFVSIQTISDYLFDLGVGADFISSLVDRMADLQRIANWYTREPMKYPSEYETVAYLVIPLLRSLGWTPQKMAVEWSKIDVALFDELPRDNKHLCAVIEAKKFNQSCLSAIGQATNYANGADRENCKRIILTDGIRYAVYVSEPPSEPEYKLIAYLNINRMKKEYPIYKCYGAKEAISLMTTDWEVAYKKLKSNQSS